VSLSAPLVEALLAYKAAYHARAHAVRPSHPRPDYYALSREERVLVARGHRPFPVWSKEWEAFDALGVAEERAAEEYEGQLNEWLREGL
jgi:hypothetical protein